MKPKSLAFTLGLFAAFACRFAAAEIKFDHDVEYANPDDQHLQLNIAYPSEGDGLRPAILCIHGGGFRAGKREGWDERVKKFAEHGYVAATVTYRLAPKYQFPAAIHDVKAAVRWLRANADKYKIDPDRIGVVGDSAGGHLVQFLGVTGGVKDFEGDEGNATRSSRVTCVVNYYGPSDFTKSYGKSVDAHEVLPLWLGGDVNKEHRKHIVSSPLYWVSPDDAPTLFIHGTEDKYVAFEQAEWIYDRLKAAEVEVEMLKLEGAGHGFKGADAEKAEAAMFAFFDRHLKPTELKSADGRRNSNWKSVEVADDRTVKFRISAPNASEVIASGDFGAAVRLTKDDSGIWSGTTPPLSSDFYSYNFSVDGVRTLDPRNVTIKPGINSLENIFEVPGDANAYQADRAVPHGDIRAVWFDSKAHGKQRRMHVYTPPGYEGGKDKYPVFYLLHGGGDEDAGWSTIGRAGFILDNLIADGKAVPMLVVMPDGTMNIPPEIRRPARGEEPSPEFRAAQAATQAKFVADLTGDIIPYVESHFRVNPGRENRALAGLSMGGGQTLSTLVSHPDAFAYVGIWSAGLFRDKPEEWATAHKDFLSAADKVNKDVKLLTITIGDKDFLLEGSKALEEVFKKYGINYEGELTSGGHTWTNWRRYLNSFAARLFR